MENVPSDERSLAIARAVEVARTAWPNLAVDADLLRRRLIDGGDAALPHAADLALALACAAGNAAALAAFEAQLGPDIERALGKLRIHGAASADLRQRLRYKLFVAAGDVEPKIAAYSGKGPLRAWLRALVVHEALSDHRRRARDVHETDSVLGGLAADDDPELDQIRTRYAGPFREAFGAALQSLSPRDRNVLRLVYTDGLGVEQVASMYGVHRVSVSRWLGQTRKDLLDRTRERLRDRLGLGESELRSLTRLCLSQIDVSLDRLLSG
ncbi:putative DNA-binding regulatory protein [Minicystis rosea]|nr:putative DNA-binding regulatory protein [Minicystis rosea]